VQGRSKRGGHCLAAPLRPATAAPLLGVAYFANFGSVFSVPVHWISFWFLVSFVLRFLMIYSIRATEFFLGFWGFFVYRHESYLLSFSAQLISLDCSGDVLSFAHCHPRMMRCKRQSLRLFGGLEFCGGGGIHSCGYTLHPPGRPRLDTLLIPSPSPAYPAVSSFAVVVVVKYTHLAAFPIFQVDSGDKGTGYTADCLTVTRVSGCL
jgi:hypothetical protein